MNHLPHIPEVRFSLTPHSQIARVLDELVELEAEILANDRDRVLSEGVDVIHAAFNLLYKAGFKKQDIYQRTYEIIENNRRRGKYS